MQTQVVRQVGALLAVIVAASVREREMVAVLAAVDQIEAAVRDYETKEAR